MFKDMNTFLGQEKTFATSSSLNSGGEQFRPVTRSPSGHRPVFYVTPLLFHARKKSLFGFYLYIKKMEVDQFYLGTSVDMYFEACRKQM